MKKYWEKYKSLLIKLLWIGMLSGIAILAFFLVAASWDIPSFEALENPEYDSASVIYSNDETIFGTYYIENRLPVEYDDLPPSMISALVSTEDARFHEHNGIDIRAVSYTHLRAHET